MPNATHKQPHTKNDENNANTDFLQPYPVVTAAALP
jgi:hypothetical protein